MFKGKFGILTITVKFFFPVQHLSESGLLIVYHIGGNGNSTFLIGLEMK